MGIGKLKGSAELLILKVFFLKNRVNITCYGHPFY